MLLAFAVGLPRAAAAEGGWTKRFEREGIAVYSRNVEGARVHEVRLVGEVDAPPRACRNVMADHEAHPGAMPHVAESRVVAREGERVAWVYSRYAFPIVHDRDLVLRVEEDDGGVAGGYRLRFRVDGAREPPPRERVVRIRLCTGSWQFLPVDGGRRTRAVYTLLVDPGGLVPAFLANKGTRTSLPDVLRTIRRMANEPKYARR